MVKKVRDVRLQENSSGNGKRYNVTVPSVVTTMLSLSKGDRLSVYIDGPDIIYRKTDNEKEESK